MGNSEITRDQQLLNDNTIELTNGELVKIKFTFGGIQHWRSQFNEVIVNKALEDLMNSLFNNGIIAIESYPVLLCMGAYINNPDLINKYTPSNLMELVPMNIMLHRLILTSALNDTSYRDTLDNIEAVTKEKK